MAGGSGLGERAFNGAGGGHRQKAPKGLLVGARSLGQMTTDIVVGLKMGNVTKLLAG